MLPQIVNAIWLRLIISFRGNVDQKVNPQIFTAVESVEMYEEFIGKGLNDDIGSQIDIVMRGDNYIFTLNLWF